MNKAKYKVVFNLRSYWKYRVFKKKWIFWIEIFHTDLKYKLDAFLEGLKRGSTIDYYDSNINKIKNGNKNS